MKEIIRPGAASLLLFISGVAAAAEGNLDDKALVAMLQKGGCYIVMRHASSPRDPPSAADAAAGNAGRERQLDSKGRESARAMGAALRRLRIPVGEVLSSPTWRAQETVKEAGFGKPRLVEELGDGGRSMSATGDSQAEWLTRLVTQPPRQGNTVVITHFPNLRAAFPEYTADLEDGEALVFVPDFGSSTRLLRRVRIDQWPSFGGMKIDPG